MAFVSFISSSAHKRRTPSVLLVAYWKASMRRLTKFVLIPSGVSAASLIYFLRFPRAPPSRPSEADEVIFRRTREERLTQIPTNVLLRNLFVHSFCTHPRLVDLGIYMVNHQPWTIPFLSPIIRNSFFKHFCGYLRLLYHADGVTAVRRLTRP